MILDGYVKDKNDQPVYGAIVEIKNENFESLYIVKSDINGYYKFDIPRGKYPFLIAVKDYRIDSLEYWCQNINLFSNITLDVSFDKLEVYGLHAFSVKGAGNGLMVYFRPMSLEKYIRGCDDIVPDDILIKIVVDGKDCTVVNINKVCEYADKHRMTAYLVQVDVKNAESWHKLDVEITDTNGNYGAATVFNN